MPPSIQSNERAASAHETLTAINAACRSRGGHYAQYSCKVVSWDDVSRGTVGGALSCWGANITDTYLKSKDGVALFTVRPDNWNEKLGRVDSAGVALVAATPDGGLAPVTLRDYLASIGERGAYAGLNRATDLSDAALDAAVSIRFQTTFLPIAGGDARGTLEFATEAYNYNTTSDTNPRNLVLLCTTQGVAVQQDGAGAKRLFHHAVGSDGIIHRHWLEAERTDHKVGGSQAETSAERADALRRGKATAAVIGTRAMGTRFNVLMTVQVPLQQHPSRHRKLLACGAAIVDADVPQQGAAYDAPCWSLASKCWMEECDSEDDDEGELCDDLFSGEIEEAKVVAPCCAGASAPPAPQARERRQAGVANAARVSRGSEHDTWKGLSVTAPTRHAHEHVTVTCVLYNTVAGGVPTADDVAAAIDDLEQLYAACGASGKLADPTFDFMKKELTVHEQAAITTKLASQPVAAVANFDIFPC